MVWTNVKKIILLCYLFCLAFGEMGKFVTVHEMFKCARIFFMFERLKKVEKSGRYREVERKKEMRAFPGYFSFTNG